ncbi:MAG: response regulator [Planctomycetota bacterium]
MYSDKDVLTTGEVAKICNVAPRTVSKWFDGGQLKGYRIPGSKDRRIPMANLITFMKEHGIPFDGVQSGRTRVLVVDEDTEVNAALERVLVDQAGYDVRTSETGFEAGVECERFRPHVILLDVHLGGADSTNLATMIRENDEYVMTRLIAMSGRLTDGQAPQLRARGFDSFLKKPFQVRQVIELIERVASPVG